MTVMRHALPTASSNLVADRLRELESRGVSHRRKLPAPAASWVYELTEWGRELEPILLALGDWGIRVPLPPAPTTLNATSVLLFLRRCAQPAPDAPPSTCRLELGDRVWTVKTEPGRLQVQPGEPANPDASLRTDPVTLNVLLAASTDLDDAVADGTVDAAGDLTTLRRLIQSVTTAPATA